MADRELSLTSHLVELRRRLVISAAALVAGTGVAFAFHRIIFDLLMVPAQGFASLQGQKLIFTQVTEMIGITMKVSLMGGLVLAFPVILFQVVMFVAPGLTSREKRYLYALFPGAILSFVAGAAFGYYALLPPALSFLLEFGSDIATPMIRIGNYINLVVTLLFWLGVAFETPAGPLLPEQDWTGHPQVPGATATPCRSDGLHPWRSYHPHLRSRQPEPRSPAHHSPVRAWHCAFQSGPPGEQVRRGDGPLGVLRRLISPTKECAPPDDGAHCANNLNRS